MGVGESCGICDCGCSKVGFAVRKLWLLAGLIYFSFSFSSFG